MLDKQTAAVLKLILEASPDGESVVIEKQDFLDKIDSSLAIDKDVLKEATERLALAGFVNVVYQDDDVYGVASLAKGRAIAEKIINAKKPELDIFKPEFSSPINLNKVFQYAFMGALIGGIIAGAIFSILSKLI